MKLPSFHIPKISLTGNAHPARDWSILIVLTIGAIVGSLAFNILFFLDVINNSPFSGKDASSISVPSTGDLESAFSAREKERARFSVGHFIDPSR